MTVVHGEYSLRVIGQVIYAKFDGSFNENGLQLFVNEVEQLIEGFSGKAFAILINDIDCQGGTPEAYKILEQHNQWLNNQNMVAKAMVITSQTTLEIIDMFTPSRGKQNIKNFNDDIKALAWLNSYFS